MNYEKSYPAIDVFRLAAAMLIVAIHTSPLASYTETGDFILTRAIARIAVPFFFLASGFFLLSRYTYDESRLKKFLKKTALLYGASIALYLPINLYNGYFSRELLLPSLIGDVLFNGTLYHLWYLPASIAGAAISWFLIKKLGFPGALATSLLLYGIGLLGDSYYGLAVQLPWLESMYGSLFQLFAYTRNGIFFAPVFFVLGGIIADSPSRLSKGQSLVGFGASLALMVWEAMELHKAGWQRHDSMYLLLPLCMYFLFQFLVCWKGRQKQLLRTSTMFLYIIHPMAIVFLRVLAKLLHQEELWIENSLLHFLAVSFLSASFSFLAAWLLQVLKKPHPAPSLFSGKEKERAYIEIDAGSLSHNIQALQQAMPEGCELMAVVKADAYGHGAFQIATCTERLGVKAFAVATAQEGIALRRYGIQGEILILGYTSPDRARELRKFNLTQTLISYGYALELNRQGVGVKAHIKIDTGMRRLGFDFRNTERIAQAFAMERLKICGIYTHLCASDSLIQEDVHFTQLQIGRFYKVLQSLEDNSIPIPKTHIQSSYGLLNYPELKCDYVRVGIALYGALSSSNDRTRLQLGLRPVLSLKSSIVLVRKIRAGEAAGYGRCFTAHRDSLIAILPIGYADGLPRNLSCENGAVLIHGQPAPIIGKVCMDQLIIDVTDIPNISVGDTATLIGRDGNSQIWAETLAGNSGTIANEVLSRMGSRLKA